MTSLIGIFQLREHSIPLQLCHVITNCFHFWDVKLQKWLGFSAGMHGQFCLIRKCLPVTLTRPRVGAADPWAPRAVGGGAGPAGSDADVYLMSWAGIWFTLGKQTVYGTPHLPRPLAPFHFPVMLCRSLSGLCGNARDITRVTPARTAPSGKHISSGLGTGCRCRGCGDTLMDGGNPGPEPGTGPQRGRGSSPSPCPQPRLGQWCHQDADRSGMFWKLRPTGGSGV